MATTLSQTQVRAGQMNSIGMEWIPSNQLLRAVVEITKVGEFYVALGDVIISPGPGGIGQLHPGQRVPLLGRNFGRRADPHMIEPDLKVKEELKAPWRLREQTGIEFVSA